MRRYMREALGVTDESPLKSRQVRNSFEHMAERLEDRLGEDSRGAILVRNIGPPAMIEGAEVERIRTLRSKHC
jgi:hypothetical protein